MAARRLLAREQLHESLSLNQNVSPYMGGIAGLQAALALLAAIVLLRHSQWPHLVGFAALGALAALFGRFAPMLKRHGVVWLCALQLTAAVFLISLVSWWGAAGTVVVLERTLATAAGGVVAWLLTCATDFLRVPELARIQAPSEPQRPLKHILLAGARIGVGAAVAALIAHAAGWNHPSWAAIGATAVMQGGHLHITMNRALQRMAGTLVGSLLVWMILAAEPPFWVIVAFVAFFQYVTEVIIGYNYALGQITVTPMALLMTYLASPVATAAEMSIERVFDTMLGAVLGIVFAVIFSTMDDRLYLAKYHRARNSGRSAS